MNSRTDLAGAYERLWADGSSPDLDAFVSTAGPVDATQLSRLARIDQWERWQRGDHRPVEEYLDRYPSLRADCDSVVDLIYHEYLLREGSAQWPTLEEFTGRFPEFAAAMSQQVIFHCALVRESETLGGEFPTPDDAADTPHIGAPAPPKLPSQFGRYRVLKLLGRGGMGDVYLVEDPQLGRQVALKLPRVDRNPSPEAFDRFRREARIAGTFHHPNLCPVYDFGELEGMLYLTMPCLAGQPLSVKLQSGPLPETEAVQIAQKVARAMSVAHRAGVVHRDLKPSNIFLREDGEPVVMDFGLAQRSFDFDPEADCQCDLVGTLAYMPPEQLESRDHEIRPTSDVYSLGVILYEMLTGRPPFEGSWQEVWKQIQFQSPLAPSQRVSAVSSRLDRVCMRALAKDPCVRFASMDALAEALADRRAVARGHRRRRLAAAGIVAACLAVIVGWFAWRTASERWAQEQVSVVEQLAKAGRTFDAYDLAVRVREYLPDDAKLTRQLMPALSDTLSITTEPPGASVFLQRFVQGTSSSPRLRTFVGTTPLMELEIARGDYLLRVEKDGYVPFQRTLSAPALGGIEAPLQLEPIRLDIKLTRASDAPAGMVFVPGGEYRLVAWRRPTEDKVKLDDYFIDKFEVTNRQYQQFVEAGGYLNGRFWTQSFQEQGRTLPWKEALARMTDRTGMPGPRGWSNQMYPEGRADHPVTGITWYEAAAYARWRGKSLPTIFQWEKAARNGATHPFGLTMPWGLLIGSTAGRANFESSGTVPVGSLEFGVSPFGCHDMAGNVAEWCLNEMLQEFIASGGSWRDHGHEFGYHATYPGFLDSALYDQVGFRCVWNPPGGGDQGAKSIDPDDEVPRYTPEPEEKVRTWFRRYQYEKAADLNGRIIDRKETNDWRREKIAYQGADGDDALAYLYLPPRRFPGPHQVIHFVPAGDVWFGLRSVPQSIEADYGAFLRSGRAIFTVVQRGFIERERPDGWTLPSAATREYVDEVVAKDIIDWRRGMDYLETRDDVDASRTVHFGSSAGNYSMLLPAVDDRYRAVVLVGAGYKKWPHAQVHREANMINFAPLIRAPILLVHGLWDETTPLKTEGEPLFKLFPEPKLITYTTYEGGHRPDPNYLAGVVNAWLDQKLGRVKPSRSPD